MRNELTPIERVREELEDYAEKNGEIRTRCPRHNGNSGTSLNIREGDGGRVLLHCFGGCDHREILDALGLEEGDLFPPSPRPRN